MDAVVRNFEIIGEAANRVEQDFKDNNPEIEWQRIRGFRNRIVHDYFGIDYEIVWEICETYVDELIELLESAIGRNEATWPIPRERVCFREKRSCFLKSIDFALKRPDDFLLIVLLRYGTRDKKFNYVYCELYPEVAATGETRLHRYFRTFVFRQK